MNENQELSLQGCWMEPHSNITYLEKGYILAEFKNNSKHVIEIIKIQCHFQAENGLAPTISTISPMVSIKPRNLSPLIKIPFVVDLFLTRGTNYATIKVTYRRINVNESVTVKFENPDTRYLIISPVHSPEKHFFISHNDPEQTALATKLDQDLIKIGFMGYVAENDKRPGLDIWYDKIIPKIDDCVALIVLWTSDAKKDSKQILREARHAKMKKKKIITLVEKDVSLHSLFKGTKEYVRTSGKIKESDLIDLIVHIEKTYRAGGYET